LNTKTPHIDHSLELTSFKSLFKSHFNSLCAFAISFVHDEDTAKDIVHQTFIKLWEKRDTIDLEKQVKSYLFSTVHNLCLNYIRDNKKFSKNDFDAETYNHPGQSDDQDVMEKAEFHARINKAIDSLPKKCRQIFIMNRFDEMKYQEIADKLGISIKTVEGQISKALKMLREQLADYITIIFLFILFNFFNKM
jgi:RNA polymerase sigma-70 factor (ECF subfamily)